MGATCRKPLSRDTDTGEKVGLVVVVKINVLAIPETPVFKNRRRRVSEEKGGLIGEGCWELRAGQQGKSGRRKDEVREEMDGLLRSGR